MVQSLINYKQVCFIYSLRFLFVLFAQFITEFKKVKESSSRLLLNPRVEKKIGSSEDRRRLEAARSIHKFRNCLFHFNEEIGARSTELRCE
jgi:hypothetical protein